MTEEREEQLIEQGLPEFVFTRDVDEANDEAKDENKDEVEDEAEVKYLYDV